MSLLCAAVALLIEFRGSLGGLGGSDQGLQRRTESEDVLHGEGGSKDDEVNVDGERGLNKRLDVSP